MLKTKGYKSVIVFAALVFAGGGNSVFAASQGSVGVDSTGTTDITLTISNLVRVSDMTDIALGTWAGSGDEGGSDTICVYANSAGNYTATFSGDGGASAFTLANGADTIPYTVTYNDTSTTTAMTTGTPADFANAHQTAFDCGGASNGTITITVAEAAMAAAPVNTYTGTLTMLVAPR